MHIFCDHIVCKVEDWRVLIRVYGDDQWIALNSLGELDGSGDSEDQADVRADDDSGFSDLILEWDVSLVGDWAASCHNGALFLGVLFDQI